MVRCPRCAGEIEPDWDWCQLCGYDPEGLRPAGWTPSTGGGAQRQAIPPSGGWASGPGRPVPPPARSGPYPNPSPRGPAGRSTGRGTGTAVVLVVAILAVAAVVAVGAVTLVGKNAKGTTASSASAPEGGTPISELATPPTTAPWPTWQAPDGTFSVEMPATPSVGTAQEGNEKMGPLRLATVQQGDDLYAAAWADAGTGMAITDPSAALTGALKGMAQGGDFTVTSQQKTTFAGINGAHVEGVANSGSAFVSGNVVIYRNRMLMLMAVRVARAGDGAPPDFDRFFASLHLN